MTSMTFQLPYQRLVWVFGSRLMQFFVDVGETDIIRKDVRYLRIEGRFYCGIGCLFLLYGLYRALEETGYDALVLTVFSLGTRVALALPAFFHSVCWRSGNLVVSAYWLAPCGRCRASSIMSLGEGDPNDEEKERPVWTLSFSDMVFFPIVVFFQARTDLFRRSQDVCQGNVVVHEVDDGSQKLAHIGFYVIGAGEQLGNLIGQVGGDDPVEPAFS